MVGSEIMDSYSCRLRRICASVWRRRWHGRNSRGWSKNRIGRWTYRSRKVPCFARTWPNHLGLDSHCLNLRHFWFRDDWVFPGHAAGNTERASGAFASGGNLHGRRAGGSRTGRNHAGCPLPLDGITQITPRRASLHIPMAFEHYHRPFHCGSWTLRALVPSRSMRFTDMLKSLGGTLRITQFSVHDENGMGTSALSNWNEVYSRNKLLRKQVQDWCQVQSQHSFLCARVGGIGGSSNQKRGDNNNEKQRQW